MKIVPCHLCGGTLSESPDFASLWRVSSDCLPFPPGGRLGVCQVCGLIQKPGDDRWQIDIARIYAKYDIYHQAGGVEQSVFDSRTGEAQSRSSRLAAFLLAHGGLSASGSLLDVGCGNGAMLRAVSQQMPGWRLAGLDLSERYQDVVMRIPGVERFYSQRLSMVDQQFDVVTLIHALEHIPAPGAFLRDEVRPRLAAGAAVFIEVPDISQNPFDLLVADHASHFERDTLTRVMSTAGFEVIALSDNWVAKELTLLARPGATPPPSYLASGTNSTTPLAWLMVLRASLAERIAALPEGTPVGVFGTSIAATWIASELGDRIAFFVDEDPARGVTPFMDRPVVRPAAVAPQSIVLVVLAPVVAGPLVGRLSQACPAVSWWSPGQQY